MSKGTLLLADDSITIQKVVNLTFADEGIDVVAVGDGDTAAARLQDVKPDIVLADVNMPGLTGYQICEMVRQNEATKDLPVVLLVGSFEPFDEAEANRVGASAYMTKPFQSIRQLVSQVTDLMEGKAGEPQVVIPTTEPPTDRAQPVGEARSELNDIESLYQNSFSTDSQNEAAVSEPARDYVDAGMDDEMILTTYTDDSAPHSGAAFSEEPVILDTHEVGPAEADAPVFGQESGSPFTDEPAAEASGIDAEDSGPRDSFADTGGFDQFSDTVPLELGESHGGGEEEIPPIAESDADAGSVVDIPKRQDATLDDVVAAAAASSLAGRNDFDEVDLLEIPGVEGGKTVEFTTENTAAATETPTQVVSLSPELMEIIVQKVVEKLSEKY